MCVFAIDCVPWDGWCTACNSEQLEVVVLLCWSTAVECLVSSLSSVKHQRLSCVYQSLEFITETRILVEINVENRRKIYFPWKKKSTSILFFYEN